MAYTTHLWHPTTPSIVLFTTVVLVPPPSGDYIKQAEYAPHISTVNTYIHTCDNWHYPSLSANCLARLGLTSLQTISQNLLHSFPDGNLLKILSWPWIPNHNLCATVTGNSKNWTLLIYQEPIHLCHQHVVQWGAVLFQMVYCEHTSPMLNSLIVNQTWLLLLFHQWLYHLLPRLWAFHHVHWPKSHLSIQQVFLLFCCASFVSNMCDADGQCEAVQSMPWNCVINISKNSAIYNLLLLMVLYLNPISLKSLHSDVLPPVKSPASFTWNWGEHSDNIKILSLHVPKSLTMLSFLCFCTTNRSSF